MFPSATERSHVARVNASHALADSLGQLIERAPEPARLARLAVLLRPEGVAADNLAHRVASLQESDGGWADVEETVWCAALLGTMESQNEHVRACHWLQSQRQPSGGWGRTLRDQSRIPTTGLVMTLLPTLASRADLNWLLAAWRRDLDCDLQLTYKGGFFLLAAVSRGGQESLALAEETVTYLRHQQDESGGFGPWKGHPIGSDPWSTGICLVGLCSHPDLADKRTIERAIKWLCDTQLPSGYWPYHFIDEGSAYAYWGLTEAIKFLEAH